MLSLENNAHVTFFMCSDCGSCVDSEAQTTNFRRCIFFGSRETGTVTTKCLLCSKRDVLKSRCVYQSKIRNESRITTLPIERLQDPTLARVDLACPFSDCPSKKSDKPNLCVFQKAHDDEKFSLLYTCPNCLNSWTQ